MDKTRSVVFIATRTMQNGDIRLKHKYHEHVNFNTLTQLSKQDLVGPPLFKQKTKKKISAFRVLLEKCCKHTLNLPQPQKTNT